MKSMLGRFPTGYAFCTNATTHDASIQPTFFWALITTISWISSAKDVATNTLTTKFVKLGSLLRTDFAQPK